MARRHRGRRDGELHAIYCDHVDAVFAFCAYSVDRATAEDLTAATFERAIRHWDRFDPSRASARTWLISIARNQLLDHYRRARHRRAVSVEEHPGLLDALESHDSGLEARLTQDELRGWLAHLSGREREVLALRYGADLPAADIGEVLDLTASNVHQIISRAMRRLREVARTDDSGSVSGSA